MAQAARLLPTQPTECGNGRLCVIAVQRHVTSTPPITAVSLIAMALASAALLGSKSVPGLLVVFVLFQGAGNGVMSITPVSGSRLITI